METRIAQRRMRSVIARRSAMALVLAVGTIALTGCGAAAPRGQMDSAMFAGPAGADAWVPVPISRAQRIQQSRATTQPDPTSTVRAVVLAPAPGFEPLEPLSGTDAVPAASRAVPVDPSPAPPTAAGSSPDGAAPTTAPTTADAQPATTAGNLPTTEPTPVAAAMEPAEATRPAAAGVGTGVYLTLGGVVAKVNGTPIFADTVIHRLDKELTAKARELSEIDFKYFAEEEILHQVDTMVEDEFYNNEAIANLDTKDQQIIDAAMVHIKQDMINQAGGSIAQARQAAVDQGDDLDQELQREHRELMSSMMQHKIIEPLVQFTASDMRNFYRVNFANLYSTRSRVLFRVIQADPAAFTGADPDRQAKDQINTVREQAAKGADFTKLATEKNTDPNLSRTGGDPGGWMGENTYRLDDVEKAVWALKPGQITPVIHTEGAYYIARLEDKQLGETKTFEDPAVQEDIFNRLTLQQRNEAGALLRQRATTSAIITVSDENLSAALDMAMQKYAMVNRAAAEKP